VPTPVFPKRIVYIIKMEWLALPDEILINTIDNAETFERIKLISRGHYRRLMALEEQFYTKLLGNKTPKALYKAKAKECAYLVSYEAQDGAVHMYLLHEENRANVADKLSKWVEDDIDYFLPTQYNDTLTIKIIDLKLGEDPCYLGNLNDLDGAEFGIRNPVIHIRGTTTFVLHHLHDLRYTKPNEKYIHIEEEQQDN